MEFKVGDYVTFADGVTAIDISNDVGGMVEAWQQYLSAGDIVTGVPSHTKIILKESRMWCYARHLKLMDPKALEPDAVWSARWTKMMEE